MSAVKLNETERIVLRALCIYEGFVWFSPLISNTGYSRAVVRRACRSLKRKGLAKFSSGLWRDDGSMGGSGYAATKAGIEMVEMQ